MLIRISCIIFLLPATMVSLYYTILALYALLTEREDSLFNSNNDVVHNFAIIIPAHNEESIISYTLQSCASLDYPKNKYKVFVLADNCSDKTVEIVSKSKVTCMERYDQENKGKGFALAWAFERILPERYDAIVILDADCTLDTHALRVFDQRLKAGDQVLQANYTVSNPDINPMSYALAVGNFIENDLFYAPKSKMGLSVFLRGTGMVLHRDVLNLCPWRAHSIAEDSEYTIDLLKRGIKVRFVRNVKVQSEFPVCNKELNVQRMRWSNGNFSVSKTYALRLMWEGIKKGQGTLLDAGWTLFLLSRPVVLLELFITMVFCLLYVWLSPGPPSWGLLITGIIIVLIQGLYFGLGIILLGINKKRIKLLSGTPLIVFKLMIISFLGILKVKKVAWIKTPRPET